MLALLLVPRKAERSGSATPPTKAISVDSSSILPRRNDLHHGQGVRWAMTLATRPHRSSRTRRCHEGGAAQGGVLFLALGRQSDRGTSGRASAKRLCSRGGLGHGKASAQQLCGRAVLAGCRGRCTYDSKVKFISTQIEYMAITATGNMTRFSNTPKRLSHLCRPLPRKMPAMEIGTLANRASGCKH